MRYLGIDYGAKKVGIAVSDDSADFAFPVVVLDNSDDLVSRVSKICEEHKVGAIVVGESKDYSQKDNVIMKEIKPFVANLEKSLGLSVHMQPEFMTSVEAERLQGKNDMHDASAAALILKSYLDTIRNHS